MNHDYAHCLDFTEDCPQECFRAELSRDLARMGGSNKMWISWMSFKETGCCPLDGDDRK